MNRLLLSPEQGASSEQKIEEVTQIMSELYAGDFFEDAYQEVIQFSQRFKKDPEWSRYRLFHILIGSTPTENDDLFDKEGEFSVYEFSQRLLREYGEKSHS